jgi:hypothetical protein
MVDKEKYPGFDMSIRKALYRETIEYFYHVLTGSKNMLDLISSNYTFLSKELADFYGMKGRPDMILKKLY